MPMPRWFANVPKYVFNGREIRKGRRPVLTHVGRRSGNEYHTPLDAHPVDGGYIFALVYGPESDWAQNILAAGAATLRVDGDEVTLGAPELIDRTAAEQQLSPQAKLPPGFLNVDDFLRMDLAA